MIEEEGTFGEQAYLAWQTALGDWREMGEVDFPCPEVGTVKLEYTSDERAELSKKDFGNVVLYWSGRYGGIVNYRGWTEQCIGESWVDQEGQYQRLKHVGLPFLEIGPMTKEICFGRESFTIRRCRSGVRLPTSLTFTT